MQIDLQTLETRINTNAFIYNGENLWPIFRNKIGWIIHRQTVTTTEENNAHYKFSRLKNLSAFFLNILTTFNFFWRYDYILLTASDNYRYVDKNWVNRLTSSLHLQLSGKKVFEIQQGIKIKHDINGKHSKYASYTILNVVAKMLSYFICVGDIQSIKSELAKFNLKLNEKKIIQRHIAEKIIFKWLFKNTKAKKIYMTSYSYFTATSVANNLGIDTVEFQHGNILHHFAYDVRSSVNNRFYPKYLCVFSDNEKSYLNNKMYINNKSNIIVIGNYAIDLYRNKKNQTILDLKKSFSLIICVSLEWTVINKTVEYIKSEAKKNPTICFILMPRTKHELSIYHLNKNNIRVFYPIDTYEIIANCDVHLTCSSTCAIEAPSLGVRNIFLNINNVSRKYFADYIKNKDFNYMLEENQSLSDIPELFDEYNREKLIFGNNDIISMHYNAEIIAQRLI